MYFIKKYITTTGQGHLKSTFLIKIIAAEILSGGSEVCVFVKDEPKRQRCVL